MSNKMIHEKVQSGKNHKLFMVLAVFGQYDSTDKKSIIFV